MKALPAAAVALLLSAVALHGARAAEVPYIDDRSDATAVIRSFYSAVSRHEYARAWGYFGETKPTRDFEAFAKGYDNTDAVDVLTGGMAEEGAAGSIYYTVPVAIRATDKSGAQSIFAGCYTLRKLNAEAQEPPFDPIHIEKAALKASDKDFDSAVPENCGDGPPLPKVDRVLEAAKASFAATYGGRCDPQTPDGTPAGEPTAWTIRYKDKDAAEDEPEREVRLFRFFCSMGAYNESSVYYIADDVDGTRPLQFAAPELDIRYVDNDSEGKVESIAITGFQTDDQLVNSDYDDATKTITTFAKWRGVGDASSSGTYLFRHGTFNLVQYDVDASYDGEINPETVLDYNTPP